MFTSTETKSNTAKLLLAISLVVFAFYSIGLFVIEDVYRYALAGAIYEFLWLPMLLSLVVIPALGIVFMIRNKHKDSVYAVLAILFTVGSIIILATT